MGAKRRLHISKYVWFCVVANTRSDAAPLKRETAAAARRPAARPVAWATSASGAARRPPSRARACGMRASRGRWLASAAPVVIRLGDTSILADARCFLQVLCDECLNRPIVTRAHAHDTPAGRPRRSAWRTASKRWTSSARRRSPLRGSRDSDTWHSRAELAEQSRGGRVAAPSEFVDQGRRGAAFERESC